MSTNETETKIFGLSIKEWVFVLGLLGVTGDQILSKFTGKEELDHKVDDVTLRVEIDSLKAQMSRTFNQEAMDAIVAKEVSEVTGRDIDFIRAALDGVEESNKGQTLFDSIYKPFLDDQMDRFDGACGYIVPGDQINDLQFVDCFGQPKKIYHGIITGITTKPIYYYRNDNDEVVPVRSLNKFIQ
jgi:hypothetical protein